MLVCRLTPGSEFPDQRRGLRDGPNRLAVLQQSADGDGMRRAAETPVDMRCDTCVVQPGIPSLLALAVEFISATSTT